MSTTPYVRPTTTKHSEDPADSISTDDMTPAPRTITPRSRQIWDGDFSIYWLGGSCVGLYFTFIRGYNMLHGAGPFFTIHLACTATVMASCVWNVYHIPTSPKGVVSNWYRKIHIWFGRVGLVAGFVSVVTGAVVAWWERYDPMHLSFAIGITAGGIAQTITQIIGWRSIRAAKKLKGKERQEAVQRHAVMMQSLFYSGCLIPAVMRLPAMLGLREPTGWSLMAWGIMTVYATRAVKANKSGSWI
ncbi:hypothetical protein HK104_010547 [Borealophlyctis nickersoniae]|nr:hypothetical protein HK104_010547 [Borealophlyctis nickersoniae]